MRTLRLVNSKRRVSRISLAILFLGMMVLISACGGDTHKQQQASQNKLKLDQLLQQAQTIGVPVSILQPITRQEQDLNNTKAPFTLFNDQPATDYYQNVATRYDQLQVQVQGLITASTEQYQSQAQQDMQNFQAALAQRRSQGVGNIQAFTDQFKNDQTLLGNAQFPKDYLVISKDAHKALDALNLMQPTYTQLLNFKKTITQMQQANLDVTAMQLQYQKDLDTFNNATEAQQFQNLSVFINAHYDQAVVNSMQSLPYVSQAKLDEFKQQIGLLKTYGMNPASYQKRYDADQVAINNSKSIQDYLAFSKQIDADIASMHNDLVQGQATYLIQQFHQEVATWGKAHAYYNKFDGQYYELDNGYMARGLGEDLDRYLSWAYTPDDYQNVLNEVNNALFNLHLLEADYSDTTPYNQIHATDLQMIDHYKLQKGQLLMVSLVEQAMRVFQDGKLVRSFRVTTGRLELPSVPGVWSVLDRKAPTKFKSTEPKTSPYWYPDTPINYAILYHSGGYFVHDSWWRADYGPGTQFPHYDSGGDQGFAGNGSHGCINMQEQEAAWVYANTDWNTQIVIY